MKKVVQNKKDSHVLRGMSSMSRMPSSLAHHLHRIALISSSTSTYSTHNKTFRLPTGLKVLDFGINARIQEPGETDKLRFVNKGDVLLVNVKPKCEDNLSQIVNHHLE